MSSQISLAAALEAFQKLQSSLQQSELSQFHTLIGAHSHNTTQPTTITTTSIPATSSNLGADSVTVGSVTSGFVILEKDFETMKACLCRAKELSVCNRTHKALATLLLLQEDRINGTDFNYISLLRSAYESEGGT